MTVVEESSFLEYAQMWIKCGLRAVCLRCMVQLHIYIYILKAVKIVISFHEMLTCGLQCADLL